MALGTGAGGHGDQSTALSTVPYEDIPLFLNSGCVASCRRCSLTSGCFQPT